jgi:hypothetical protein
MEEVRPAVVLLRSVSPSERVGEEIVPQRRNPPGEFQGVNASPDVVEDLADDRSLGDEPYVRGRWGDPADAPSSAL